MGVGAVNVGRRDLAAGLPFVSELGRAPGVPWVSTNLRSSAGGYPFPRWRVLDWGESRIAVIGLLLPAPSQDRALGIEIQPPAEALREALDSLSEVDAVVCLSNLGLAFEKRLASEVPGVALIVGGGTNEYLHHPPTIGNTVILHASDRGRYLGVVDLPEESLGSWQKPRNQAERAALEGRLRGVGQRVEALRRAAARATGAAGDTAQETQIRALVREAKSTENALTSLEAATTVFNHRIVALDAATGEDPEIAGWVRHHKTTKARRRRGARTTAADAARKRVNPPPSGAQHRGSASCRKCHGEAYGAWITTPHARAYASLEPESRAPRCLGCHATSLRRASGSALEPVVGCEACHGPGGDHPTQGEMARRPDEEMCRGCHNGFHQESGFDFSESYDRIRCDRAGRQ
jgi:hypothetical protein